MKVIHVKYNEDEKIYQDISIYTDDPIIDVKRKLCATMEDIAVEELYLFSIVDIVFDNEEVFTKLTQSNLRTIDKKLFVAFLSNIIEPIISLEELPLKEEYTYKDIQELQLHGKTVRVKIPLGIKHNVHYAYTVVSIPLDVIEYDTFLSNHAKEITSTENNKSLFEYGTFVDNTIYVCSLLDCFRYHEAMNLPIHVMLQLYFPILWSKGIHLRPSEVMRLQMIEETLSSVNENKYKRVDAFRTIHQERKQELDYKSKGITLLHCFLHSYQMFVYTNHTMFKLLNATKEVPFIKYNPGHMQEKLYKLYTQHGNPYLKRSHVMRYRSEISMKASIGFIYINDEFHAVVELYEDGMISIKYNQISGSNSLDTMFTKIREYLSPLYKFAEKEDISYTPITHIHDHHVEIVRIKYVITIDVDRILKPSDFKKYATFMYPIFNFIGKVDHSITLTYKRVSNFNEMDSKFAMITQLVNQEIQPENIIENIQESFSISLEEALSVYENWLGKTESERVNKKIRVKENPGFSISFQKERIGKRYHIQIDQINRLEYIEYISLYIDVLLRIVLQIEKDDKIIRVLNKNKIEVKDNVEDVKSNVDEKAEENQVPIFQKDILEYDDDDDDMFIADELFDDDDDEEEEEEDDDMMGGANTDSEEEFDDFMFDDEEPEPKPHPASLKLDDTSPHPASLEAEEDQVEEEDQEEEDQEPIEERKQQLIGQPLTFPNTFQHRLHDREPNVFIKDSTDKKTKLYSRVCAWNLKRQPVIISKEEKEYIDKVSPDSYNKALKYKSKDGKESNYYICPRYWCMLNNTPMTKEQVERGECGNSTKVIPKDAKTVPEDAFVFEFNSHTHEHTDQNGAYKLHTPGLHAKQKAPNGSCIPCCYFKSTNNKLMNSCNASYVKPGQEEKEDKERQSPLYATTPENEEDNYIISGDKFPIEKGRRGFLPPALEVFLDVDPACRTKNTNIKYNVNCFLRYGVEKSNKRSFVAVMADILRLYISVDISIDDMIERIVHAVDLDRFTQYMNGNLIELFSSDNDDEDVDIEPYKSSTWFSYTNENNKDEMLVFKHIVQSYRSFLSFLQDENSFIDHTYLWDIVCDKNEELFPNGLNLFILDLPQDDVTQNVNLVCPTNQYVVRLLDKTKPIALLLRKGEYYEPIYVYRNERSSTRIIKLFDFSETKELKSVKAIFTFLEKSYYSCKPKHHKLKTYTFKNALLAPEMVDVLEKNGYMIEHQVIHYDGRVVGLQASKFGKTTPLLPCYPSGVLPEYKRIFMDHPSLLLSYEETRDMFLSLQKTIPVKPVMKVLEDNVVVGVLTETNQFVPTIVDDTQGIPEDGIETHEGFNYIITDKDLFLGTNEEQRENQMKKIKLEHSFFHAYRKTVKHILHKSEHIDIMIKAQEILQDIRLFYDDRFNALRDLFTPFLSTYVKFVDEIENMLQLDEAQICFRSSMNECKQNPFCFHSTDNDTCQLYIPRMNLVSSISNETNYLKRVIDEMIRHEGMQNYYFTKENLLYSDDIVYKENRNELIVNDSNLESVFRYKSDQHVDVEVPVPDMLVPMDGKKYSNIFKGKKSSSTSSLEENKIDDEKELECISTISTFSIMKLKAYFDNSYKEKKYHVDNPLCTLIMVQDILQVCLGKKISREQLKNELIQQYNLYKKNIDNILYILKTQGKIRMVREIFQNKYSLSEAIKSEDYYFTNLDIMLLLELYKIPALFISSSLKGLTEYFEDRKQKHNSIWATERKSLSYFVIIRQHGIQENKLTKYSIIMKKDTIKIRYVDLKDNFQELLQNHYMTPQSIKLSPLRYLVEHFKSPKKPTKIIVKSKDVKVFKDAKILKRCPKGTRRNKKTKKCERFTRKKS